MEKQFHNNIVERIRRRILGANKRPAVTQNSWNYSADALALAQFVDCSSHDLALPQQHPERIAESVADRICNWYMPVFDNASYGGIMTILRLANYLLEKDGVRQRFLICGSCNTTEMLAKIGQTFPALSNSEVIALDSQKAIEQIPPSDYSVATLWTTAYVLLKVQNTGHKFYMIQDFEPLFYPAGSTYSQTELSYRFGFYGIANTKTIADIYKKEYGGKGTVVSPCIDTSIFYPGEELSSNGKLRLFYYARPGMPRNCFELAVPALKLVKQHFGDRVQITCAGQSWDPADYGLEHQVETIGMLPYAETGDLYRSCHVGLTMMATPHPSYLPFEMMGCGTLVVANYNQSNTWLLKDRENCLIAQPTSSCLAEKLIDALDNYHQYESLRHNAAQLISNSYSAWNKCLKDVAAFIHNPEQQ